MIRTLCTLAPGTKSDGTRCLKGELSRDVTTVDEAGHERTYPRGTPLVLSKQGETYHLLAVLDDEPPQPRGRNTTRAVAVRRHWQEREGDALPF